jgi:hypothetical protein
VPGYFGGKASWSECEVEPRLEMVERESRFEGEDPEGGRGPGGEGRFFSSSWIDGSLVASEVRRETGGDK